VSSLTVSSSVTIPENSLPTAILTTTATIGGDETIPTIEAKSCLSENESVDVNTVPESVIITTNTTTTTTTNDSDKILTVEENVEEDAQKQVPYRNLHPRRLRRYTLQLAFIPGFAIAPVLLVLALPGVNMGDVCSPAWMRVVKAIIGLVGSCLPFAGIVFIPQRNEFMRILVRLLMYFIASIWVAFLSIMLFEKIGFNQC